MKKIVLSAAALLAVVSLSACGVDGGGSDVQQGGFATNSHSDNVKPGPIKSLPVTNGGDPRSGWVEIQGYKSDTASGQAIAKRCDGTTLLYVSYGYRAGGITSVPNSPECK